MPLRLSQFVHHRFQEPAGVPIVLTLHRYGEFTQATRDAAVAMFPDLSITGIQAAKGVYLGRDVVGYQWFVGPLAAPSPVHFGDALAELERFFWDELDRQDEQPPRLPFLLGWEQGGQMALSMAGATPHLISGVIAIDAQLPDVPGWDPPLGPLDGLPVLIINPVGDGEKMRGTLESWGATVQLENGLPSESIAETARTWLADQTERRLKPEEAG